MPRATSKPSGAERYLDGALVPSTEGVWSAVVDDGIAWLSNTTDNSALRYYDLPAIPVAFLDTRAATDGAPIEARIQVDEAPDGGAGLLIGYPRGGSYLVFAISADQRFRVLRKQDGRLTSLKEGTSDAIAAQDLNLLRVEHTAGGIDFLVNGTTVYQFEAEDPQWEAAPVGIAAFGRGRFGIDEVRVEPPGIADEAIAVAARNSCELPSVDPAAQLVTVGIYEGQALANVSLGSADDVTSSATLHIEAGNTPLYLVVNSYDPLIWRLDGDTDRIAHLAVIGRKVDSAVSSGATGIAASKVSFHGQDDCLRSEYDAESQDFRHYNAMLALWLDRAPAATLGTYDLGGMSVPGGTLLTAGAPTGIEPQWDAAIVAEALRFSPAGLVSFDPAEIITNATIVKLKTLPQEFGLAQLVAAGSLVRDGQFYRVTGPMRYPAGLYGAHSVNFAIEPGIAEPTGDPGHSRVERLVQGDDTVDPALNNAGSIITLQ